MNKEEFKNEISEVYLENDEALNECVNAYNNLYDKIDFLTKRENKLQQIETMFANGNVDLERLSKLVKGELND